LTTYLTLDDVRGLHIDVMDRTGFVPAPLRNEAALESAIMRAQTVAHYEDADVLTQAVTLILAISQAQAFVDGNKRTAMYAGLVFLELNGHSFGGDSELLAVLIEEAPSRPQGEARAAIVEWMRPQVVTEQGRGT
jgi:death on curing protein